jgi:cell division septation protein DedD
VTAAAESPPAEAPAAACAACGARLEPGQAYCLECGSRIAYRRGPLGAVGRMVEGRFGRSPGDWIWMSLLLLGIAAGGATAAIALTDDGTGGSDTIVATSTPPIVSAPATTAAPPPTATAGLPTPPAPPPAPKPALLKAWPTQSGYTVVLASIPARGTGRNEARSKAQAALEAGLPQVGILVSDNFASLHPGYYVVFSGVYDSLEDAITASRRAGRRFPAAYARQIAR